MSTDVTSQITEKYRDFFINESRSFINETGLFGSNRFHIKLGYLSWVKNRFEQGLFNSSLIKLRKGGD